MKQIRRSKISKIIAFYLAIMIFLELTAPMAAYALTEGPSQPEFNSFTPISTTDMVDLASGDFNYNIPIMDVGGYPINLSYDSGVTMDQEASWVGLGWNLNLGQINRQVRGLPDDFQGDEMVSENNMKDNITLGINTYINAQLVGAFDKMKAGGGMNMQYNNYTGMTATPSFGLSFAISDNVSVGMKLTSSSTDGVSVTPSASLHTKQRSECDSSTKLEGSISPSITYNSRQGLQSFNLSSTWGRTVAAQGRNGGDHYSANTIGGSGSGSYSFINNTFTPKNRLAFNNTSGVFSFSVGPDAWSLHAEFSIAASVAIQQLRENTTRSYAYGYENTDLAPKNSLLDFNREKEQANITKNTKVLPITNYTHDLYTIQGQGIGGMFRPHRSQIGYVEDAKIEDKSNSLSLGGEIEGGGGVHVGASITYSPSNTYTAGWNTQATPFFKEKVNKNPDYEKVYFKALGESKYDPEYNDLFIDKLGGSSPITLKLGSNKNVINGYWQKAVTNATSGLNDIPNFTGPLKRNKREKRNRMVQKITRKESNVPGVAQFFKNNLNAKDHHTLGYIVTDENGSRNIYGETAYNKTKREATFATNSSPNCTNGLVPYSSGEDSQGNSSGLDHFYNSETTPAYAHTYLISSVLSPDYEDVTGNGPTDDDMGSYTKFEYKLYDDYKWRVPFTGNSFNEGYKTLNYDQKASYLYGEKELKYVHKIITKTHVAFFDLEERKDGIGSAGKSGGAGTGKMYKIKSIRLYSKPEVLVNGIVTDPGINSNIKPIKTAHFEYDYSLCKNIDNNNGSQALTTAEGSANPNSENEGGKLTLKKVYFTYKGSNMGKFAPYKFTYAKSEQYNPDYNPKNYDIWGNYMPNAATSCNDENHTTPQEFPYVNQNDKTQQDIYAAAWSLSSIQLPSGGLMKIEYESDDYQYVQDRKAMRMFKVEGVSYNSSPNNVNTGELYTGGEDARYVVIKTDSQTTANNVKQRYIGNLINKPIFFNFLVNMANNKKDYVQGYFKIDDPSLIHFDAVNKLLFIPMEQLNREGKNSGDNLVNPISLAGWYFGRQYMNREIYGQPSHSDGANIVSLARSLANNIGAMVQIYKGPNGHLKDKKCAKYFNPKKSWIRLLEPDGIKLGGGARVKKINLYDEWDDMLGLPENTPLSERYKKQYGQSYEYTLANGSSSGVATYEPNVSKENPFVLPFYHNAQNMIAPPAVSYTEEPFGESFFPSPTVTYSRVTVKNTTADGSNTETGKVITQHYTSRDFPTKTGFTTLDGSVFNTNKTWEYESNENQVVSQMLAGILGLPVVVKTDLTMTQGFSIETNDMNGKLKKQEIYNQTDNLISSVEYVYSTGTENSGDVSDNTSILNNKVTVIDRYGKNTKQTIGVEYDVVNDFRQCYSNSKTFGINVNIDMIPVLIVPVIIGMGVPESADHTQILRTSVTTKVVHKTGILKEKIAFDLGSKVSTKNLAWDADTGQVLLTETTNEFDDKYYTLNYPAYWFYDGMGMASDNADIKGELYLSNNHYRISGLQTAAETQRYLKPGDELLVDFQSDLFLNRVWVISSNDNGVKLIKKDGSPVSSQVYAVKFRVLRSGQRNMQMASMASVTSMRNPLGTDNNQNITASTYLYSNTNNPGTLNWRVLNANAVEYSEAWASQCENGLPRPTSYSQNPYLYNILGEWRASRSYAYLTSRSSDNLSTRLKGFFKDFQPLYVRNEFNTGWVKLFSTNRWTFASKVVKHSPYGAEIENKDVLGRYSSAQYGYKYKLPVAVAANTRYQEIGYDGFEDYDENSGDLKPHFGFSQELSETAKISKVTSHTGKRSIAINPNNRVVLIRTIEGCGYVDDTGDNDGGTDAVHNDPKIIR
jgi:hypothetical protein